MSSTQELDIIVTHNSGEVDSSKQDIEPADSSKQITKFTTQENINQAFVCFAEEGVKVPFFVAQKSGKLYINSGTSNNIENKITEHDKNAKDDNVSSMENSQLCDRIKTIMESMKDSKKKMVTHIITVKKCKSNLPTKQETIESKDGHSKLTDKSSKPQKRSSRHFDKISTRLIGKTNVTKRADDKRNDKSDIRDNILKRKNHSSRSRKKNDTKKPREQMDINEDMSLASESKKIPCRVCIKTFSSLSNRRRHETRQHNFFHTRELNKLYSCRVCNCAYTTFNNRRRHEIKKHNFNPDIKQVLKCSECLEEFKTKNDIMKHISTHHPDIVIKTENKQFKNMEEFQDWKINIEKETSSRFVSKRSNQIKKCIVKDYLCHRSGSYKSKCENRQRKFSGSKKCGFFCPARMNVREGAVIDVLFVSTHIGHQCDVRYLPLSLPEKNEIAGLMATGVPIPTIMDKIALTAQPTKRLASTKTQDLRNIRKSYGIRSSTVKHFDDVVSVNSWVEEMNCRENSPILLHNMNRLSSTREKLTKQQTLLRSSHKKARSVLKKIDVMYSENDVWVVPSFTKLNEIYNVKRIPLEKEHVCNIKCDYCKTCIHEYQCECPESSVKYNMCKHIHLLCIKKGIYEIEKNTQLVINMSPHRERSELEKVGISDEMRKQQDVVNLKGIAKAVLLSFVTKLDEFTSEAQYNEIIKAMSDLERKCLALDSVEKQLPSVSFQTLPLT